MTTEGLSYTWIGNATAVLRLGAFAVLTDPNFLRRGQRAYLGKGLWSRRLKDPAMQVGELPPLDAVVLSHLHGDHFDRVARRGLDRRPPLLTTPAAARRLQRHGFDTHGMSTWERVEFDRDGERLAVEALPGVHAFGAMGAAAAAGHGLAARAHRGRTAPPPASTSAATPCPAPTSTRSPAGTPTSTRRSCTSAARVCSLTP